jgi:hypothetical protein
LPGARTLERMDLFASFTGVLLLPDRAPFGSISAVRFGDGRPAATIRWHNWSSKARFEVLAPDQSTLLAAGHRAGFSGRNYEVAGAGGAALLQLRLGFWGGTGRSTVSLPDGRSLSTKGNWSARRFAVSDEAGQPVAHLVNTSRLLSLRPDDLAFELTQPVLSVVLAIGLAQCMRAAVEAQHATAVTVST